MSGFWTSIVLVSEAGLEVPSPAGRGACRVIWILPCGAEGVLWTVTLVLMVKHCNNNVKISTNAILKICNFLSVYNQSFD